METSSGQASSVNKRTNGKVGVGVGRTQLPTWCFQSLSPVCTFLGLLMTCGTQRNSPTFSEKELFGDGILIGRGQVPGGQGHRAENPGQGVSPEAPGERWGPCCC